MKALAGRIVATSIGVILTVVVWVAAQALLLTGALATFVPVYLALQLPIWEWFGSVGTPLVLFGIWAGTGYVLLRVPGRLSSATARLRSAPRRGSAGGQLEDR